MSTDLKLCIKAGLAEPCHICGRWIEDTQGDVALFIEGAQDAVCIPCGYGIDPLLTSLVELAHCAIGSDGQTILESIERYTAHAGGQVGTNGSKAE
jgi:hypothetical protein